MHTRLPVDDRQHAVSQWQVKFARFGVDVHRLFFPIDLIPTQASSFPFVENVLVAKTGGHPPFTRSSTLDPGLLGPYFALCVYG